ncbi:MAG: GNAT family N-acetyltransferase [Candidatus Heimdallarchaeota archaeon]|nr:GNAT family N-acetyltransferase [Candidatus Heimdallarchaeota archaeon]
MVINIRSFKWKEDYRSVQNFLIDTFHLTKDYENWLPTRFENRKVGPCGSEYLDEEDEQVTIWEIGNGFEYKIIAVVILEIEFYYSINIHPEYKTLEKEIILWLESNLLAKKKSVEDKLHIFVYGTDKERISLLTELGYTNLGFEEYDRKRSLNLPVTNYSLPEGFTIRSVNIKEDFLRYKEVLGEVFHHCKKMTENTFRIFTEASFYKPDLDIVAVAPDGNFAAFCTIRLDPIGKIAEIEPVGTHSNYRQLGLGKAVLLQGLKNLEKYKPTAICIQGAAATEGANRLYESIGFIEKKEVHLWQKSLKEK